MSFHSNLHLRMLETKSWHDDTCRCQDCRLDKIAQRRLANLDFSLDRLPDNKPSTVFDDPRAYAVIHTLTYGLESAYRCDNQAAVDKLVAKANDDLVIVSIEYRS